MGTAPTVDGKFEILSKMREGGMGAIYLARHRLLGKHLVIKVMRPQYAGGETYRDRFLREGRNASELNHPNIASLNDFSIGDDGTLYMVMEFIDGVTFRDMISTCGVPPLGLAVELSRQALSALGYLHRFFHLVHRDIAPDNLMLATDQAGAPVVKLIDLGIARRMDGGDALTQDGSFLGKLQYCSPEQLRSKASGARVDHRSDLFSFGLVFYELLVGSRLYPSREVAELVASRLGPALPRFDEKDPHGRVPEALRDVARRALEFEPDARFQNAEEFSRAMLAAYPAAIDSEEVRSYLEATKAHRPEVPSAPLETVGSAQLNLDSRFALGSSLGTGARVPVTGPTRPTVGGKTGPTAGGRTGPTVVLPTQETARGTGGESLPREGDATVLEAPPEPVEIPPPHPPRNVALLVGIAALVLVAGTLAVWRPWVPPPARATAGGPARPSAPAAVVPGTGSAPPSASSRVEPPAPATVTVVERPVPPPARSDGTASTKPARSMEVVESPPLPVCMKQSGTAYKQDVVREQPAGFAADTAAQLRAPRPDSARIQIVFRTVPASVTEEQEFVLEGRLENQGDMEVEVGRVEESASGAGSFFQPVSAGTLPQTVDRGASYAVYRYRGVLRKGKTFERQIRVVDPAGDSWIATVSLVGCAGR